MTNFSDPFYVDSTVPNLTIPVKFVGMHSNGMGSAGFLVPSVTATANVTLGRNNVPVVTMTAAGAGYTSLVSGSNGNSQIAAVFRGGDPLTHHAVGIPVLNGSGGIAGVNIVDPGDYQTTAPTVAFVVSKAGINPADTFTIPPAVGTYRTHDYRGVYPNNQTQWGGIETSQGVYNWAVLDECVLYHAAMGRDVMFTLLGTPSFYATATTYSNANGLTGGMNPLNSLGLTLNTAGTGLWGFITALMTRYNGAGVTSLVNPITGLNFASGTKLLKYLEVWNEPVFGAGGAATSNPAAQTYWIGTASQLADIARITKAAAKVVDSTIKILGVAIQAQFDMGANNSRGTTYNFLWQALTALDSVNSLAMITYLDGVSIHAYDLYEQNSPLVGAGAGNARNILQLTIGTVAAAAAAASVPTVPVHISEWGWALNSGFWSQPASVVPNLVSRIMVEHALAGIQTSCPYAWEAKYTSNPATSPYAYAKYQALALAIQGKTTTQISRSRLGRISVNFSDGSTYTTG